MENKGIGFKKFPKQHWNKQTINYNDVILECTC